MIYLVMSICSLVLGVRNVYEGVRKSKAVTLFAGVLSTIASVLYFYMGVADGSIEVSLTRNNDEDGEYEDIYGE